MDIEITDFCKRQYSNSYSGNHLNPDKVKKLIELAQNPYKIVPGYSDFSCLAVIKNKQKENSFLFPEFKALVIKKEKAFAAGAKLETAYKARNKNELAVLTEWVTGIEAETAPWIHLILYSKEQLAKEKDEIKSDWGLVSVSSSLSETLEPMLPITAMRNALGVKEGGSGFALDHKTYQESVKFWSKHIKIKV